MGKSLVLPSISIIIPTLNSEKVLGSCLKSIAAQEYPPGLLEVIISDGGSSDSTLKLARIAASESSVRYKRVQNKLKTGEAGKAAGLRAANGEIVAFIDSDNILPDAGWLRRMIEPFTDPRIAASEPLEYSCRNSDGYITRYCAYLGMNDPICLFIGNYDRYSMLTGRWTEMPYVAEDRGGYFKIALDLKRFPTIGANGFLIRRDVILGCSFGDYLFDIDIIHELLESDPGVRFAKVKTGIIHLFSGDVRTFVRKQRRRIRDYNHYTRTGVRRYPWKKIKKGAVLRFVLSCVTVVPLLSQVLKGYLRKPDSAWLFHPLACWLTLLVYGSGFIKGLFGGSEFKREGWSQ